MLGTNIGKKVTAGVVHDQYNEFLKNKNKTEKKKTMTVEERKMAKRDEMRKRGIMVKADDKDETPTIIEHGDGTFQPYVFVIPEKPVKWKAKKRQGRTNSTKASKKSTTRGERASKTKKDQKSSKNKSSHSSKKEKSKSVKDTSEKVSNYVREKELAPESSDTSSRGVAPKKKVADGTDTVEERSDPLKKPEEVEEPEKVTEPTPMVLVQPIPGKPETESDPEKVQPIPGKPESECDSEKKGGGDSSTETLNIVKPSDSKKDERLTMNEKSEPISGTIAAENPTNVVPPVEKQANAFEMLDDEEFEKVAVSAVMSDADEKEILKLAHKLLKVAKQNKALEKCLSPAENEILAKFFSGKQPLTPEVLSVLDGALDKIIDYLEKSKCELDDETKKLMKRRTQLKAAMMKEFLVSPQYLPKLWTHKFNEWKAEAANKKFGINWFKIFFEYPKHKGFEDGPEDTFGNFKRRDRHFVLGILIGPNDVKSFEETKRESDCQGMFLDTKLIERAEDERSIHSQLDSDRKSISKSFQAKPSVKK